MNMKKALAAVLAVVIAISAMAVSVFAVDAVVYAENEIPLLVADPITNYTKVTYKFEVPVYAQFGYLTDSNYLKVTLPANLSYDWASGWEATPAINWSVEVNGTAYDLKDFDYKSAKYTVKGKDENGNVIDVEKQGVLKNDYSKYVVNYINFGYLAHGYFKSAANGSDVWATVPQSQMVGDTTSITLVATINLPNDNTDEWALFKTADDLYKKVAIAVQMFDSLGGTKDYDNQVDDTMVTGSYVEALAMTKGWEFSNGYDKTKNLFLSRVMSENDTTGLAEAHLLTWDHNLANRAKVMGTTTAKVVVETLNPIVGIGFYNLYAVYQNPTADHYDTAGNTWWDISTINTKLTRVSSSITVTSATKKLEFEIDPEILYNTNYGVFNKGFVVGYVGVPSYNNADFKGDTELNIYNNVYWPYLGSNTSWGAGTDLTNYAPSMLKAYILVDAVEEEVVTPDAPLEGGDVEVDEDVEVEENPATGLVLAVLPMVIAAAAVVIFKR